MNRKKVVFLVGYFPLAPGGAELQTFQIASELKNTHDIFFISIDDRNKKESILHENGFTIYLLPKKNLTRKIFKHNEFMYFSAVKRILAEIKPNIIYQRCANYFTWIAHKLQPVYKYRFIYHCANDLEVSALPQNISLRGFFNLIEKIIIRRSWRTADCIYVQNDYQYAGFKSLFPESNIKLIYNFSYPPRIDVVKKYEELRVVWVANIKPVKNPQAFLRIAKACSHLSQVKFIMIGKAGEEDLMNEINSLMESQPNFEYVGYKDNGYINNLLQSAHLLVNTSYKEGFSNVFVQSWFRGVPVLSLYSDPDHIISKNGLGLIANGNEDRIVDFIIQYASTNEYRTELADRVVTFANNTLSSSTVLPRILSDF